MPRIVLALREKEFAIVKQKIRLFYRGVMSHGGLTRAYKKALLQYRYEGLTGLRRAFSRVVVGQEIHEANARSHKQLEPVEVEAESIFSPRVLIIAEMSIPQCKKYRVVQKKQVFSHIGIDCTILDWTHTTACLNAISTHSLVIFYRMPDFPEALDLIHEANRLNVRTIWEVDDLIFDREVMLNSRTLSKLDREVFDGLLDGARGYRDAMLACREGIASTSGLADAMLKAGVPTVSVIENALDQQTMLAAEKHNGKVRCSDEFIRIVYGSGTNTHNVDFEEVAEALIDVLREYPLVRFRLIGLLELPEKFEPLESQIERIEFCDYEDYLGYLAECDISIAPLENYIFNEAKSNIKFLEASIVKVPSVCSPRSAFTSVIVDGENGLLAESSQDWKKALEKLVQSANLRKSMAEFAYNSVLNQYKPAKIAQSQLAPLMRPDPVCDSVKRILSVNIYYSPVSFGGATIVAEEVNKHLNYLDSFEVYVFTALRNIDIPDYSMRRYNTDGLNVFAVSLPEKLNPRDQFDNPYVADHFDEVIAAVKPDIVHFHCLQGLGVAMADRCSEQEIPYYVTLHDPWWICGRQFMLDKTGSYCNQKVIDAGVCAGCVEDPVLNVVRQKRLKAVLDNAKQLMAPSEFFATLHRQNGFSNGHVIVNKNGILKPLSVASKVRQPGPIRFGYVGGYSRIKGFHLVEKVFRSLGDDVRLIVVDNMTSLGFSSYDKVFSKSQTNVEVIPAYSQETIDDFFSTIDVLLFPTQWKESFGLTVREALARNVWVIVTDAGGVTEDIIEGVNGEIIPFNDRGNELKKAVIRTVDKFSAIEVGAPILWDSSNITWFEDQAAELAEIFSRA